MSGDLNENLENRRRRPIPVPLYDDHYIERPYLKKVELAKIRDNLDELVDIKKTELFKDDDKSKIESKINQNNESKIEQEIKKDEVKTNISDINITNISPPLVDKPIIDKTVINKIVTNQPIINSESKNEVKNDIKFGISNLVDKSKITDKNIDKSIDNKQNKSRTIKRKVIRMSDDEISAGYNISPEDRRRLRKSEIKEFQDEEETAKAVRKAAEISEQNARELKELKSNLAKENEEIKKELKLEFGSKLGQLDQKFGNIEQKFGEKLDNTHKKLEETCVGIECLKNDLAKLNKNIDLVECPECHEKIVPPLASFCPGCSAHISGWTEDDGTPVKNWKPNWEK